MGLGDAPSGDVPDFGAACDGDADRNMILGEESSVGCQDMMPEVRFPGQSLSSMLPRLADLDLERGCRASAILSDVRISFWKGVTERAAVKQPLDRFCVVCSRCK